MRGDKVIAYARKFLDESVPLSNGAWTEVKAFAVTDGQLVVTLGDGLQTTVAAPGNSSATAGMPSRRRRCCCPTTACTSRS